MNREPLRQEGFPLGHGAHEWNRQLEPHAKMSVPQAYGCPTVSSLTIQFVQVSVETGSRPGKIG